MHRAFRALRGELQQLRYGFEVPVCILGPCMAEIGAELAHLTIGVEPPAIPRHDCANGEGVPKIVDARATSVLAVPLRLAQTDPLRDDGKVVAGRAFGQPVSVVVTEECSCRRPEEPHALETINAEPIDRARRDGHEARATGLPALHP